MAKILIVDDEKSFRETLAETIRDLGFATALAGGVREALAQLERETFAAIFIDFRMPEMNGIDAIKVIREKLKDKTPPLVMITAFFDSQNTISAMKLGAYDHLTKPIGRADIERVLGAISRSSATPSKPAHPPESKATENTLLGHSEEMRSVLKMIGKLSSTATTALITGETGTGKELVARAIHDNSGRSKGPFVAVNCAAIPENLLESELFGHVKGAFTGASGDRKGSFKTAEGGTLFLDEIGDMNLTLQAKMLRALQEREITPVGSSKPIKFDARVIAATHRDLKAMVEKHEFREDLFFRLDVVELKLPPLRERKSDLPLLATHFLNASEGGARTLSETAEKKLLGYAWPGNVRELKNVLERASVLSAGSVIHEEDIRFLYADQPTQADNLDLPQAVARLEQKMIRAALLAAAGNRSEAARKLGIQRQALYAKMKEHQID